MPSHYSDDEDLYMARATPDHKVAESTSLSLPSLDTLNNQRLSSASSFSQIIDSYADPVLLNQRRPSASSTASSSYRFSSKAAPRGPRPLPAGSPRLSEPDTSEDDWQRSLRQSLPIVKESKQMVSDPQAYYRSAYYDPQVMPSETPSSVSRSTTLSPQHTFSAFSHLHRNASTNSSLYSPDEQPVASRVDPSLLSHCAVYLRDHVPRTEHTRGAIPFPRSFTGSDIVNTMERALSDSFKSRKLALHIARSLHTQLFFFEIRDNTQPVEDGLDQVFCFAEEFGGSMSWEELPTGVITEVTGCYSPLCGRLTAYGIGGGGCLSPSCPNNLNSALLKRQASSAIESIPATPKEEETVWAELVPPELLQHLEKAEITRQNQIHELINEERKYVKDIELLRTEFLEPLTEADPPIISPDDQSAFFSDVLLNAFDVKEQASTFVEGLVNRQREQAPVIQNIGDLALMAALDWTPAYMHYYKHSPFADARVRREKVQNAAFDAFLTSFTRRPNTRKLTFHSYHTRITFHLPRVILMLQGILKHTAVGNPDREDLHQAIDILQAQCREMDGAVAASEAILECRRYHNNLLGAGSYLSDLDLLSEARKMYMHGKMYRRPESSGFNDWVTVHVALFDHYFLITKHKSRGSENKYQIVRRVRPIHRSLLCLTHASKPIPLELLTPLGFDEPPQPRSTRLHLRTLRTDGDTAPSHTTVKDDRMLYPLTFNYSGRQGGLFTLFVESASIRKEWQDKLTEAIEHRQKLLKSLSTFDLAPINTDTFAAKGRQLDPPRSHNQFIPFGKPTCSVTFTTPEGHSLVAIGHEEGLWIGLRRDPTSFRLVLHLKGITQCTVLQEYGLLLVLAGRVLIAYPLEALVPSAATNTREHKEPQRLSGSKDVLFFRVGKVGPRLLVIYVKKDGVTQTVFKALEPIAVADRGTKGFMRKKMEWFREYKEFFIPSEVFGLLFLRSQLSIVCAKGFELMAIDKEPLRAISFPDWTQLKGDSRAMELQKRCNESKAVGMYRISEAIFLFVFEDLAFYADKHGDPLKDRYQDVIDFQATLWKSDMQLPVNFVKLSKDGRSSVRMMVKPQRRKQSTNRKGGFISPSCRPTEVQINLTIN